MKKKRMKFRMWVGVDGYIHNTPITRMSRKWKKWAKKDGGLMDYCPKSSRCCGGECINPTPVEK